MSAVPARNPRTLLHSARSASPFSAGTVRLEHANDLSYLLQSEQVGHTARTVVELAHPRLRHVQRVHPPRVERAHVGPHFQQKLHRFVLPAVCRLVEGRRTTCPSCRLCAILDQHRHARRVPLGRCNRERRQPVVRLCERAPFYNEPLHCMRRKRGEKTFVSDCCTHTIRLHLLLLSLSLFSLFSRFSDFSLSPALSLEAKRRPARAHPTHPQRRLRPRLTCTPPGPSP